MLWSLRAARSRARGKHREVPAGKEIAIHLRGTPGLQLNLAILQPGPVREPRVTTTQSSMLLCS